MSGEKPVIWWVRRDLRLDDNPCLASARARGAPIIPVFILDRQSAATGAAPLWRWGLGLDCFARSLSAIGGRLIFRTGEALSVLRQIAVETGAQSVVWSRLYDPDSIARDTAIKQALRAEGIGAHSHGGHLLFEPWSVTTKTGGYYRVFTPMWKSVRGAVLPEPAPALSRWPAPEHWPASETLTDWDLGRAMNRGAAVVAQHQRIGEAAALERLDLFTNGAIRDYAAERDLPGIDATSRLSTHLTLGEIGPRRCWHAGLRAREEGAQGAETFLKELVWREFAYQLIYHTPHITTRNWREDWDGFPWNEEITPEVEAWQQGRTGIRFVDAAMREMYVTGTMHNRARMIVASYLCKHLMTHWRVGQRWFEQCLTDWDPASNAMGWQWAAGSGPDASPYFRVFNPVSQLDKFDRNRTYADAWIAEGKTAPSGTARAYFDAIPKSWGLSSQDVYPDPVVTADAGRRRALDAYENRSF